jgi:hypothetical protein
MPPLGRWAADAVALPDVKATAEQNHPIRRHKLDGVFRLFYQRSARDSFWNIGEEHEAAFDLWPGGARPDAAGLGANPIAGIPQSL